MKPRLLLPAIMLVFFAAACLPSPEVRDPKLMKDASLISGDPCLAPCWNGIIPGETSWNDAVTKIEDEPDTFTNPEIQEADDTDARALVWNYEDGPACCQMFTRDGSVVDTIFLLRAPDTTVGEVLNVYGEPRFVIGEEVSAEQALLSLIYPDVPLVVYAFVAGKEVGELTASSEVVGTIYMTAEDMASVLETSNLYNWEGYQSFADYIDEAFDHTAVPVDESAATAEADSD